MRLRPYYPLARGRALVVEDDLWIAEDVAGCLRELGLDVIGPFPTAQAAESALREGPTPTVAVLDVGLRGADCFGVADALVGFGIPYVFHTGYDARAIPSRHRGAPLIVKPAPVAKLATCVGGLCGSRRRPPEVRGNPIGGGDERGARIAWAPDACH